MSVYLSIKELRYTSRYTPNSKVYPLVTVVLGEIERVNSKNPSDEECYDVIRKMIKNTKEMIKLKDTAESQAELQILESMLPEQASVEDLKKIAKDAKDLGTAMKMAKQAFGKNFDTKLLKDLVNASK